eukprot:4691827-Pyramimonas_sp.AAC.1
MHSTTRAPCRALRHTCEQANPTPQPVLLLSGARCVSSKRVRSATLTSDTMMGRSSQAVESPERDI